MLLSFRCSDYFVHVLFMSRTTIFYEAKLNGPYHIHSLRSRCFIKKSSFNVAGNLVTVVKFTFQSVFGNSRQNPRHASARGREGARELYSILWSDWPTSKQKVHAMEIVLLLGFADAIFRRQRSDDRKCVCASQAKLTSTFSQYKLYHQ